MKIRKRLTLSFIGTSLLLAFVSYNSKITNIEIRSSALVLSEKLKQEVEGASDILLALQATQIPIHELLDKQSVPAKQKQTFKSKNEHEKIQTIKILFARIESSFLLSKQAREHEIENYKSLKDIDKEKQWHKKIESLNYLEKEFLIYKSNFYKFLKSSKENNVKLSEILESNLEEQYRTKLLPQLNDYKNGREQELVTQSNKVLEVINGTEQQILIATIFSLISAVLTGTLISRSILKPLNKLKEAAEKIGQGEFHTRVDIRSRDEVEVLANAFNQMMDDLSKTTVAKYYLDQIINSMTDSLIVVNLDSTITRTNHATINFLGYAENELIGQQLSVVLTPKFHQLLELNKLREKVAIANIQTVYLTKEGRQIPVSFSASVMQDANQQIQGIVCVAHDITERKEAEKLNTLLVTAVDYAADAIEITDAQARYEYVNFAFEKITGYKYSDVIGKTPASFLRSGKHDDAFYQKITNILATGQVWSGCYIGKRKDGTLYHQEVTISPVSNAAGVITHHVAVKRDVTERKQVEEALRQSQANLSALIENTQDAVWSVDTEYKVVTFNTNFKQQFLLAYGIELKIGMNIVECLSPEIRAVWLEDYNHALAGKPFCFEQHYEFASVPVDIEFSFNPIFTEDGKVIGVSAFGRNITEHKQAQKRLKKINECFLSFGTDPIENINRLTALYGELLGAAFTLYSDIEEGMLCCVGQWQAPSNYNFKDIPQGHICYDVIQQSSDEIFVVHDLPKTKYAQTDSNVRAYELQTYVGKAVKCRQSVIGSLCALYQKNYIPTENDRKVISIIASAIGVEEERRATQKSLRESEERYALAARAANDGLWDWNLKTNKVYFSPRSKALLGCRTEEIGDEWEEFFKQVHPGDINELKTAIATHLEGLTTHFQSEYRVLHQNGQLRWILCRGLAVRDGEGKPYRLAGSQTDITERKSAESQLLHQAFHDALTGLPNRLLFMERLESALLRSGRVEGYQFAVLFLDLDRFKVVNDSLGHNIGDQLLVAIASRLEACLRPGDTVSRLGGDEFIILLEDIKDASDATLIANRILQYLSMPFRLSGHEVFTTTSIGIAISHSGYKEPEDLLRDADTVMYRAKALGKARFEVFNPTLHNQAMARLQLEIDLRRALERQELQVYYQPIVSLNNSRITGFEALVRWQHPQLGFVSPAQFIPVAEETGLIIPLDLWVLRQACQQMRTWQQQFPLTPPLTISVNLSGKQLAQPDVVQKIEQILQHTGFNAHSLKLEITESVLVENATDAAAILKQLKALGIGLSIDDFGTGYSSLSYLHRLPIDTLKIDRSFVNDVDCDPEKIEIIRTVVALAWNLSMDIVAEGVETKKQMYQLQALRCEYGQGYLFSKPVDSQKAEALLSDQWMCDQDLRLAATI
jgi:diguanylate cyclase (GGDEF)-like protein/PAS domain S-box-containing protein